MIFFTENNLSYDRNVSNNSDTVCSLELWLHSIETNRNLKA